MCRGADDSEVAVRVVEVSRSYVSPAETVWAVRDANLSARAGEYVCVFGASGSGKSTLLGLLAGLDVADTGRVLVGSAEVGRLDEDARARLRLDTVGVVFQDHNLIEEFTAAENVALPLEVLGAGRIEAAARAAEQLDRVGLAGLADRLPAQLSGGQRQRVGIARALVGDRRVLLADEPTGALDSKNSRDLYELVRELCDQGAVAIVCSHDPTCREFADTVYEMVDGRLIPRSPSDTGRAVTDTGVDGQADDSTSCDNADEPADPPVRDAPTPDAGAEGGDHAGRNTPRGSRHPAGQGIPAGSGTEAVHDREGR